jgi:hypothetical protein
LVAEYRVNPLAYYSRPEVQREIAEFLRGRWAAVEGPNKKWARWLGAKPLKVESPSDVFALVRRFQTINARSFYGTIEVFRRLEERSDVEESYEGNVVAATPFIDVDIVDENKVDEAWQCALQVAGIIVDKLCEEYGVCKSVYLLWSGAGVHVRIHERAFSRVYKSHHPLDVAFAAAELVLEEAEREILDVILGCGGMVKVENLVAPKRVFTAPLSLHRKLDRVAVAFRRENLDSFKPSWSLPASPHHDPTAWRTFEEGEADEYAEYALRKIGKVKHRTLMEARAAKISLPTIALAQAAASAKTIMPGEVREPGRFPVMALLQAARYYLLRGDLERAKSWGLNRAIFYAWAKYYGPARRPRLASEARRYSSGARVPDEELRWDELGGEKAQVSPRGWYVIGGVEQKPEDFDRHVARKFEEAGIPFEEAWKAALEYLKKFPRNVLRDPQRFYKEVYEPVRDSFVEKVLKKAGEAREARTIGLDRWLKGGASRGQEEKRKES